MIRINPKHQAFPDCQVLNLCQVSLIKEEFINVIWHFSFLLSKMIHLRDMHSACLKKKLVNLHWLTYLRNLCHILLKLPSLKKN